MECVREKDNRSGQDEGLGEKSHWFLVIGSFFLILIAQTGDLNAQDIRRNRPGENPFRMSRTSSEAVFTRPNYVPLVSEAYFYGSSDEVYPNPNTPPQAFIPAAGVSQPVPDEVLRAKRRNERFARIQRLRGRSEVATSVASENLESVPFSVVFPEKEARFSMEETLPPEFLHQDGTTRPLPHPDKAPLEVAPPQVLDSLEDISNLPEIEAPQNHHSAIEPLPIPSWEDGGVVPVAYYTEVQSQKVVYPNRSSRSRTSTNRESERDSENRQENLPYPFQRIPSATSPTPLPVSVQASRPPVTEIRAEKISSTSVSVPEPTLYVQEVQELPREDSIPHYEARRGLETASPATVPIPSEEVFRTNQSRRVFTESERSTLPWFAKYIRDMEAEEYQLVRNAISHLPLSRSLIRASIVASRPENMEKANALLREYYKVQQQVLAILSPQDTELEKASKILQFIHEELLTGGYQLERTTMENLFQGRYNCVTATILYCSLGRQAGLKVTPVELPGHAMCWVYLQDGSRMDVETTCKEWFQYLDKPAVRNKVIEDLILQANPGRASQDASRQNLFQQIHPISDEKLLAKIYYNRGVDLLAEKDFAGALEANAIALLLDSSSETTRGNLLATMNNWAISLCQEGNYAQAAELLREGIQHEPEYAMFRNNHVHVFHRWVESLYRSGYYSEALQITERGLQEQPHQPHLQRLYEQIRTVATPQTPVLQ